MGPKHASEEVVSVGNVSHPIAQRFIYRIFKCARAGINFAHFGAKQFHAKDVERLALHVGRSHVDDAFEIKQRADCRHRHAVLAGARLCNHAPLAHALGQECLTKSIVYFVRAGVCEIFALEIDARAAGCRGKSSGVKKRRGTPGVVSMKRIKFGAKIGIAFASS